MAQIDINRIENLIRRETLYTTKLIRHILRLIVTVDTTFKSIRMAVVIENNLGK